MRAKTGLLGAWKMYLLVNIWMWSVIVISPNAHICWKCKKKRKKITFVSPNGPYRWNWMPFTAVWSLLCLCSTQPSIISKVGGMLNFGINGQGIFLRLVAWWICFASVFQGFRGRSKNCYSIAIRRVHKALQYQYVSRRLKKREMRSLWISRINIATREHNVNYSKFVNQMAQYNVQLNRKMLSELAIHEPRSFKALAELAKSRLQDGLLAAIW